MEIERVPAPVTRDTGHSNDLQIRGQMGDIGFVGYVWAVDKRGGYNTGRYSLYNDPTALALQRRWHDYPYVFTETRFLETHLSLGIALSSLPPRLRTVGVWDADTAPRLQAKLYIAPLKVEVDVFAISKYAVNLSAEDITINRIPVDFSVTLQFTKTGDCRTATFRVNRHGRRFVDSTRNIQDKVRDALYEAVPGWWLSRHDLREEADKRLAASLRRELVAQQREAVAAYAEGELLKAWLDEYTEDKYDFTGRSEDRELSRVHGLPNRHHYKISTLTLTGG